jgi:hypothetical protein
MTPNPRPHTAEVNTYRNPRTGYRSCRTCMQERESRRNRDWAADWQRRKTKRQERDGQTVVTATEGPPGGAVNVTMWVVDG